MEQAGIEKDSKRISDALHEGTVTVLLDPAGVQWTSSNWQSRCSVGIMMEHGKSVLLSAGRLAYRKNFQRRLTSVGLCHD